MENFKHIDAVKYGFGRSGNGEKVALIINPNAGKQKLAQQLDKIQSRLTEIFEEVTIFQTEKEGDGKRFVEKHAEGVDLLIAGGEMELFLKS